MPGPLAAAFIAAGVNRALNPPPKPEFTPPQLDGGMEVMFTPRKRRPLLGEVSSPLADVFLRRTLSTSPSAATAVPSPYRQGARFDMGYDAGY